MSDDNNPAQPFNLSPGLKLSGENYDPIRGVRAVYRSHVHYLSDSEKKMKLSVEIAGGEISDILEYHYKRA